MPQPKKYRHYLRFFDGADWQYWYYIPSASLVDYTTAATELERAPEGWQEYEIIFERGFTYYGLFTSFVTPLKFLKDSAVILRHIKYTFGIEAKVELLVEQLNPLDWTYSTLFRGDVDMSKTQDEYDYIIVPITEGGFVEKLKSRADTPYTYELWNNTDKVWIEHDGIEMQALIKWTNPVASFVTGTNGKMHPVTQHYITEGTNYTFAPYDVNASSSDSNIVKNTTALSADIEMKIDYNYDIYTFGTSTSYFQLDWHEINVATNTYTGVTYTIFHSVSPHASSATVNYNGTNTQTITIPAGYGLALAVRMYVSPGAYVGISNYTPTMIEGQVSGYFINRYETTYIPALKASKVFELLMNSINEDAITVVSTLLDTTLNDEHFLSSGDGVRSLVNATFTTTFSDFFTWVNSKFGAAFYYDRSTNTVYLEDKAAVFNGTANPSYTITSVDNFKCTPFTEQVFTNLSIGSRNFDYDAKGIDATEVTNGRDEWNLTSKYLSPITRLSGATKEYISPYRDDIHGIEQVRANLSGKELADASSDNEIFVIHCDATASGTYTPPFFPSLTEDLHSIYRKAINATAGASYWQINNIFSPETAYNIFYSSARCVYRNGDWFRSLFKLNDADDFKYKGSGKVNTAGSQMSTEEGITPDIINEDDDIGIMSLCPNEAVLILPFIFEFETKEPIFLYHIINDYPFHYLPFVYKGNTYYGYIIKATSKPTFRGGTVFTLLATVDTDITNLIR